MKNSENIGKEEVASLKIFYNNTQIHIEYKQRLFSELSLDKALLQNIEEMGYDQMTEIQRNVISLINEGKDVMGCAKTGSGKTIAFLLPIVNKLLNSKPPQTPSNTNSYPVVVVLAPTRELVEQIYIEARKICFKTGLNVGRVYGGVPTYPQVREAQNGIDILIATPGRLNDLSEKGFFNFSLVDTLIMDEADRMLDMGFEPQINNILNRGMPPKNRRQNLFFSATFPDEVRRLASTYMNNYYMVSVSSSNETIVNENITHKMERYSGFPKNHLLKLIKELDGNILIFCERKIDVDEFQNYFNFNNVRAAGLHGDKEQGQRQRVLNDFNDGRIKILLATDVASRGIDFPHITYVINTTIPRNIEDYVHRVGRTGRSGLKGTAITLIDHSNPGPVHELQKILKKFKQEIPEWFEELCRQNFSSNDNVRSGNSGNRRRGGGSSNASWRSNNRSDSYNNNDFQRQEGHEGYHSQSQGFDRSNRNEKDDSYRNNNRRDSFSTKDTKFDNDGPSDLEFQKLMRSLDKNPLDKDFNKKL